MWLAKGDSPGDSNHRANYPTPGEIVVQGLRHEFVSERRTLQVLNGLDFTLDQGEFLAVMGPSGCGKSTLLNIVAGFEKPTSGTVIHRGRTVKRPDWTRGVVFQTPALYPWLNVLDNVLFGPRARGKVSEVKQVARDLLKEMGLEGFEHNRPYELSGGMQHRVALARTLVNQPDVLLMDEPFAALDAQTRGDMQGLLLDLWQRHRSTVLFVTHDIEEALLLADRVIILSRRPADVIATVPVTIQRPRTYDTVHDPAFVELRRQVRTLLQHPRSEGVFSANNRLAESPSSPGK